jgi:predicted dinucleotide-binding enzyme
MEQLQNAFPEANFVKAFNCVGNAFMIDPKFESKPTMFICGNNDNAKLEVAALLEEVGWESADFGKVQSARAIEPLCILWCIPGMLNNQWSHAFKLLKM